jgi:YebC/PmpR family DNA-binding regulatory protein
MAGHSHWAGIKHKKAKEDQKRGKVFSRLAKQIMTAVREGGKDLSTNLALQYAIDAAKAVNMPKDNIERAVLKGAGELEGQQVEQVRFEGYGPGGAAVMVDALTDNRNRTTAHIRKIFGDHGGELGANGCVAWLFQPLGLLMIGKDGDAGEEELLEIAIEAGADDFEASDDGYEVTCEPSSFQTVRKALQEANAPIESAEVTQVPSNYVDVDAEAGRKMIKMLEDLEDDEDVTGVSSNFNLPPELVAEMETES